ncbi:MAG: hypothetical protein ACTSQY_00145 [Candidatus Odinarchaeia archaeon]|nr:MAG: hypothetical protein [Lokiarchaeota virus Fenrir Meg22_1012]URC17208.1 MAG: hypothetical protein [Lokiarchaeota virus Fenrir Meg22_1214]
MKFKKDEKTEEEQLKLMKKITELRDNILEEYDMMELIEDSIKDIFNCNLDCSTCTREEQGKCMQNFKKANLYWLRKIAQDEKILIDIVEKMVEMKDALFELVKKTKRILFEANDEKIKKHKEIVKKEMMDNKKFNYFT